jgi:hypothetical protein
MVSAAGNSRREAARRERRRRMGVPSGTPEDAKLSQGC